MPDPGFADGRGQALPSFANKIVDEIDVMARMKEMPDPSGAGPAIEGIAFIREQDRR
jgi:hypothetical protein